MLRISQRALLLVSRASKYQLVSFFHLFPILNGAPPRSSCNTFKYRAVINTPMEYPTGFFSREDIHTGMKLDARDTALMSLGTAGGGLQTLALKRVFNEPPPTSSIGIITSPSGIAAIVIGLSCIGIGFGTRTGMIEFNHDIATLLLGYGISAIISLGLNVITWSAAAATAMPRYSSRYVG
jgi:hypothetical protein